MVERLTAIPTLVALKDGHGDIRRLQAIINRVGERLHWIGGAATTWLRVLQHRRAHVLLEHRDCRAASFVEAARAR
jgi:hypothetical protein